MKTEKTKVQVSMSNDLLERVDKLAQLIGVSRSQYCAMAVGQYVMGQDKALEIVEKLGTEAFKELNAVEN